MTVSYAFCESAYTVRETRPLASSSFSAGATLGRPRKLPDSLANGHTPFAKRAPLQPLEVVARCCCACVARSSLSEWPLSRNWVT